MSTLAYIGIAIAVLSVLAAYRIGYSTGFAVGQDRGFGDGKREGAKEGSMRGYAVGYDRAKRRAEGDGEEAPRGRLGVGVFAIALAVGAIFLLAATGSQQNTTRTGTGTPKRFTYDRPQVVPPWPLEREPGGPPFGADQQADQPRARDKWMTRQDEQDFDWNAPTTSVPQR